MNNSRSQVSIPVPTSPCDSRHLLTYLVVLASPASAYLLDLRLAQLAGDVAWLDDFRILQAVHLTAVLASTALFPQLIVPKLRIPQPSGVRWEYVWRIQKTALCILIPLVLVTVLFPDRVFAILKNEQSARHEAIRNSAQFYLSGILATFLTGINGCCLLASGSDTALYLTATIPSLASIVCLEIFRSTTTLPQLCMASMAGAAFLWLYSSVLLYRRFVHTGRCGDAARPPRLFGSSDLDQILSLALTQFSAMILNKLLAQGDPGSLSGFSFAFKIVSAAMLPCVVASNRLLSSLSHEQRDQTAANGRERDRALTLIYAYGFLFATCLFLAREYALRIVFFGARFTPGQYAIMSDTLTALAWGAPGLSQALVWNRIYAARARTRILLGSSLAVILISLAATRQPHMGPKDVALYWSLGITTQAVTLAAGDHFIERLDAFRIPGVAVAICLTAILAITVLLNYEIPALVLLNAALLLSAVRAATRMVRSDELTAPLW